MTDGSGGDVIIKCMKEGVIEGDTWDDSFNKSSRKTKNKCLIM